MLVNVCAWLVNLAAHYYSLVRFIACSNAVHSLDVIKDVDVSNFSKSEEGTNESQIRRLATLDVEMRSFVLFAIAG